MKGIVLALSLLAASAAPFQCASDPDPERRMQDTAPEALWGLAVRFHEQGDREACNETLQHLTERYPDSRYAERAEIVLGGDASPLERGAEAP